MYYDMGTSDGVSDPFSLTSDTHQHLPNALSPLYHFILDHFRIYIEISFSPSLSEFVVVEITVEILFPYIPCFISFVASRNKADKAGIPHLLYLLAVSLSQGAVVGSRCWASILGDRLHNIQSSLGQKFENRSNHEENLCLDA
jgi:hypothetical protein